jgi:hypothetical protein
MSNLLELPIDKPNNHPIVIGAAPNPHMGRWDIHVMIGNYASEEDAKMEAAVIKKALEEALQARFNNPQ